MSINLKIILILSICMRQKMEIKFLGLVRVYFSGRSFAELSVCGAFYGRRSTVDFPSVKKSVCDPEISHVCENFFSHLPDV